MKERIARALGLALLLGLLPGMKCLLSTSVAAEAFNSGVIDSSGGDPFRRREDMVREMVTIRITEELIDGYFGMGAPGVADRGVEHHVSRWLAEAAKHPSCFCELVLDVADEDLAGIDVDCASLTHPDDGNCRLDSPDSRSNILASVEQWVIAGEGWSAPFDDDDRACTAIEDAPLVNVGSDRRPEKRHVRNPTVTTRFVDYLRFRTAVERAVREVAALLVEGFATKEAVLAAVVDGFSHTARYMAERRWARHLDRKVIGIVSKGGAATGVFSAGAIWAVMNLIHEHAKQCERGPDAEACARTRPRFDLVSGTSTGAFIAAAVDKFSTVDSCAHRATIINRMSEWFTCFGMTDMYCAQDHSVLQLMDGQPPIKGLLEFDGFRAILGKHYRLRDIHNPSELILNTVDFRSGRLFALSDQLEMSQTRHVHEAVIASAVLPFIAEPVTELPIAYDRFAGPNGMPPPAYLDGGIRSELPVMPLVRRGAERVLVVSSAASVLGEASRLDTGLEIGVRYIDVSTGGVTEGELAHAQRRVESIRLTEAIDCRNMIAPLGSLLTGAEHMSELCAEDSRHCDGAALCRADYSENLCTEWRTKSHRRNHMQALGVGRGRGPGDASMRGVAEHGLGAGAFLAPPSQQLSEVWKLKGVFRDEDRVVPVHGYDFNPHDQRRLFMAGVDTTRRHCVEIARLLGISVETQAERHQVARWCSRPLPEGQCAGYRSQAERKTGLRICGDPLTTEAQNPPEEPWFDAEKECK